MTEPDQEVPRDTDLPPEPVSADPDEAQVPPTPTPEGDQAPAGADRVLPRSPDESDVGWGGRPEDDDDERFRREVPPHW